jgi:hypothetical protein
VLVVVVGLLVVKSRTKDDDEVTRTIVGSRWDYLLFLLSSFPRCLDAFEGRRDLLGQPGERRNLSYV